MMSSQEQPWVNPHEILARTSFVTAPSEGEYVDRGLQRMSVSHIPCMVAS